MSEKCAALDQAGRRCRALGRYTESYHGDAESYRSPQPEWVRIRVCEKHRISWPKRKPRDYFNPRDVAILGGDPSL